METLPTQYMTWSSLATLAGATSAVVIIANTARKLMNWDSPFIPFITSLAIVFGVAFKAGQLTGVEQWVLGLFNGCLLFCTATGANDVAAAAKPVQAGAGRPFGKRKVKFLQPWLS